MVIRNLVGRREVYIETSDRRLFAHPYTIHGPGYRDAVGMIFQIDWQEPPEGAEHFLGLLKRTEPRLPEQQRMIPVLITSQKADAERGVAVLQGRIEYDKHGDCLLIPLD